jgi:BASS family bile acid:Na+ symporter
MIEQAITPLIIFLMYIVGASLKSEDVIQLKKQPRNIIMISLGQIILLPLLAYMLIIIFQPNNIISNGLMLAAICPGGAVSNIYTFLAKGNTALSVTLTTCNSLLAIFFIPLLVGTLFPWLFDYTNSSLFGAQSKQLFLMLLVPVLFGVLSRRYASKYITHILPYLELSGAVALLSFLMAIFIQFQQLILKYMGEVFLLAIVFSVASLAIGRLISVCLKLNERDEAAVVIEYPVRNLALTALLATSIFNNDEYLLFSAVFFVVQTPIILFVMISFRIKNKRVLTPN